MVRVPHDFHRVSSNTDRLRYLLERSAPGVLVDWRPACPAPGEIGVLRSFAVSGAWRATAESETTTGPDRAQHDSVLCSSLYTMPDAFAAWAGAGLRELIVHQLGWGQEQRFGRLVQTSFPLLRRLGAPVDGLLFALPASSSRSSCIEAVDVYLQGCCCHPRDLKRMWSLVLALPRLARLNVAGRAEPAVCPITKDYLGPALGTAPALGLRYMHVDCGAELSGIGRTGLRALLDCAPNLTELDVRLAFTLARQAPEIVCTSGLVLPKLRAVRLVLHESCTDVTKSKRGAHGCLGNAAMNALAALAPDLRRLRIETWPRAERMAGEKRLLESMRAMFPKPIDDMSGPDPPVPECLFLGQYVRLFGSHANPRLPRFPALRIIELPRLMLEHRETQRWWRARRRCLPQCTGMVEVGRDAHRRAGWTEPRWDDCFAAGRFMRTCDG